MSTRLRPSSRPRRRGFTLVEVLATMTLMGITLPVVISGIAVAAHTAVVARHRNEAAALAESQLTEMVATANWQVGQSSAGDFGADWPDYHWRATVESWPTLSGLDQIDLYVSWNDRGNREIMLSTLVYDGSNAGNGAAGNGTGSSSGSGSGKSGSGSGSGKSGSGSGSTGSAGAGGAK